MTTNENNTAKSSEAISAFGDMAAIACMKVCA
jgi:hypothetical protein